MVLSILWARLTPSIRTIKAGMTAVWLWIWCMSIHSTATEVPTFDSHKEGSNEPGMARVRGITQFYLPPTHLIHKRNEPSCLFSVSIHQMAQPTRRSAHRITAHISFIDLERMKC